MLFHKALASCKWQVLAVALSLFPVSCQHGENRTYHVRHLKAWPSCVHCACFGTLLLRDWMVQVLARLTKSFLCLFCFPVKCHSSLTSKAIAKHICLAESQSVSWMKPPAQHSAHEEPPGRQNSHEVARNWHYCWSTLRATRKTEQCQTADLGNGHFIKSKCWFYRKSGSLPEKARLSRRQIHKQHEGERALSCCFPSIACVQVWLSMTKIPRAQEPPPGTTTNTWSFWCARNSSTCDFSWGHNPHQWLPSMPWWKHIDGLVIRKPGSAGMNAGVLSSNRFQKFG